MGPTATQEAIDDVLCALSSGLREVGLDLQR